jgi:hypothetical protein
MVSDAAETALGATGSAATELTRFSVGARGFGFDPARVDGVVVACVELIRFGW